MTASAKPIRLLLVDDHFVVRSGLRASLELEDDLRVVGEAGSGDEALEKFDACSPDVVIMDMQLGGRSGIDTTGELRLRHPDARVLIFSSFARDDDVDRAMSAGALGYVQKSSPREELLAAIRAVAADRLHLPADIAARLRERPLRSMVSPREREILALVAQGRANKEIGAALGIAEDTVKRHVSNILDKLGVSDRAQATAEAIRRGLIEV